MNSSEEEEKGEDKQQQKQDQVVKEGPKGKSCKGYLYYSSSLKSHNRNPRCIGIPRSFDQGLDLHSGWYFRRIQWLGVKSRAFDSSALVRKKQRSLVPNHVVRQSEVEALKDGPTLLDFYYACAGYSVYRNLQDVSNNKQGSKTELPVCVGLELLVDRKVPNAAPTPARNREDVLDFPWHHVHNKPAQSLGDDFLSRLTRNANLVASGVARNMRRVGNHIKESLDDILYPYRKRPK